MADRILTQQIDQSIKEAEKALVEMPESIRRRTIEVKMNPDEVIKRIKQIDGVIVEFESR